MLIDPFMWRQFVALSERYGFVGASKDGEQHYALLVNNYKLCIGIFCFFWGGALCDMCIIVERVLFKFPHCE